MGVSKPPLLQSSSRTRILGRSGCDGSWLSRGPDMLQSLSVRAEGRKDRVGACGDRSIQRAAGYSGPEVVRNLLEE